MTLKGSLFKNHRRYKMIFILKAKNKLLQSSPMLYATHLGYRFIYFSNKKHHVKLFKYEEAEELKEAFDFLRKSYFSNEYEFDLYMENEEKSKQEKKLEYYYYTKNEMNWDFSEIINIRFKLS